MKTILILGSSTKAGTYVTKQFKKSGYRIIIYDWKNLPNKYSRYVDDYINVSSPQKDLALFSKIFLNYITTNKIDAILPLHDAALEIVRYLKNKIPSTIILMGLNEDVIYKYAHNKYDLLNLAHSLKIAVPKTIYITTLNDFNKLTSIKFPCIVKPISSALIKDNKLYLFRVSVVKNEHQLIDKLRELVLNIPVMIQEFIEGYGIGFNFISVNGKIINSYIHKRITETDGVSSYRELLSDNTFSNKDIILEFVKNINWTGVGMIEFKVNNTTPVLMELNGRFFGSIELCVKSKLNLPKQFLEYYINKTIPVKTENFKLNTKVRNLHDEVLLYFHALFKGKIVKFFKWKFSVINSIFSKNDFIEDNFFDDPMYVASLYFYDVKRFFKSLQKKIKLKFININSNQFKADNTKPLNIAFVCLGNICRSPFAHLYAKSVNQFHNFYSFGTIEEENRLSPQYAIIAAKNNGIDMSKHSSLYLSTNIIKIIDVFIVMDKKNYLSLLQLGIPNEKIKFIDNIEITDPYGKSLKNFETTYNQIKIALDKKIP